MPTSDGKNDELGAVRSGPPPPTASDPLLPAKGEPEKNMSSFTLNLNSIKEDTVHKVLKKASSLTRKKDDDSDSQERGIQTQL